MANFAYADLDITTTTLLDAVNDSKIFQQQALSFTVNPSNPIINTNIANPAEFSIFNENNNKFLVFGRKLNEKFITLADIDVPDFIKERFTGFDEQIFRDDISSTSLRLAENS